jgi:hypothetical protein
LIAPRQLMTQSGHRWLMTQSGHRWLTPREQRPHQLRGVLVTIGGGEDSADGGAGDSANVSQARLGPET